LVTGKGQGGERVFPSKKKKKQLGMGVGGKQIEGKKRKGGASILANRGSRKKNPSLSGEGGGGKGEKKKRTFVFGKKRKKKKANLLRSPRGRKRKKGERPVRRILEGEKEGRKKRLLNRRPKQQFRGGENEGEKGKRVRAPQQVKKGGRERRRSLRPWLKRVPKRERK